MADEKRKAHMARVSFRSVFGLMMCLSQFAADTSLAREVKDMTGRTVEIPDKIERVYATMPPPNTLMTALAPELLVDSMFQDFKENRSFTPFGVKKGGPGRVRGEALLEMNIDLALGWGSTNTMAANMEKTIQDMNKIGKPILFLNVEHVEQYPDTFRYLGGIFHREARAEKLAEEIEARLKDLRAFTASIPENEKRKVYYTESADGLGSQCDIAARGEVIELAGARNAVHCDAPESRNSSGNVKVDLETLFTMDPDVIVVLHGPAYDLITHDPRWKNLRAVANRQVFLVPNWPFSWVDHPPSYLRVIGAHWLASHIYPDRYKADLRAMTQHFYDLFFNVQLSEDDLTKLMNPTLP